MDMTVVVNRVIFFERFCRIAKAAYEQNPLDAENITKWGGALVEVGEQKSDSQRRMLKDAMSKMEEALLIDPKSHDTLWLLGNTYMSEGFVIADFNEARGSFDKASIYFQQALDKDPHNLLYKKCLEVLAKAPALHMEVHKNGSDPQATKAGTSTSGAWGVKEKQREGPAYMFGWVILGVTIAVWVGFAFR